MKQAQKISDAEMEVMRAIWKAGEPVTSTPHAMERYTIPTPALPPMSLLRKKVAI